MAHNMKRGSGDGPHSGPQKRFRNDKCRARILVSSKAAGSIIGKGGCNIQKLRSDNNAVVRVPDCLAPERILSVEAEAEDTIVKVMEQALTLMADDILRGKSTGRSNQMQQGRDPGLELRMLVNQSQIGGVIGKAGYKIKEIKEVSGAGVKVFGTCAPQSNERVISLNGSSENIVAAVKEIFKVLSENEIRGMEQPYDPINFDAFYPSEYGGYGTQADISAFGNSGPHSPNMHGGSQGGFNQGRGGFDGGMFGGGGRGGGENRGSNMKRGGFGGFGSLDQGFSRQDDNGNTETTQVTIQKEMAGAIIGPAGSRIRKIRADSRANITIDEPVDGSNERIITISGTQRSIQTAQFLLQQCVREYGYQGSGGPGFGPPRRGGGGGGGRF